MEGEILYVLEAGLSWKLKFKSAREALKKKTDDYFLARSWPGGHRQEGGGEDGQLSVVSTRDWEDHWDGWWWQGCQIQMLWKNVSWASATRYSPCEPLPHLLTFTFSFLVQQGGNWQPPVACPPVYGKLITNSPIAIPFTIGKAPHAVTNIAWSEVKTVEPFITLLIITLLIQSQVLLKPHPTLLTFRSSDTNTTMTSWPVIRCSAWRQVPGLALSESP